MSVRIVFLCPHNAAKSITAAAHMQQHADRRGLDVEISTGGTDPDDIVGPAVAARLAADGMPTTETPKLATAEQLDNADYVINIGCDPDRLPTAAPLVDWTVPNFSDDFEVAYASLMDHVSDFADQL